MLPRPQRLRTGSDVTRVSRTGARARAGDLSVTVVLTQDSTRVSAHDAAPGSGSFRAAVVVGKPAGNAVRRNRLRRRIQHALADLAVLLPVGSELVIRSGPASHALTPAELSTELRSAVVRAARRAGMASEPVSA